MPTPYDAEEPDFIDHLGMNTKQRIFWNRLLLAGLALLLLMPTLYFGYLTYRILFVSECIRLYELHGVFTSKCKPEEIKEYLKKKRVW